MIPYQDAHLHIAAGTDFHLHPEVVRVFLNSTSPEDYPAVKAAAGNNSAVVPFFGYHPWTAAEISLSDHLLTDNLKNLPSSGIGECGLDSIPEYKPLIDSQLNLFMIQLNLAVQLKRRLSIHCVRAWKHLFNCLDQTSPLPEPFILHSFYGSRETLFRLLGYGAYISISALSIKNPEKSYPVISAIPLDRILIETDMISGSPGFSTETHLQELKNIYNVASSIFRIPESDFISKVWENGTVFTN